jgi:malonyl-CoA O-methyltransferase
MSRERSVAASFDRAAARYLDHAAVQQEMASWLAAWIPAKRAGNALEVGAGPGTFTAHLVPWDGLLTASDLSPAMCAVGRRRLPSVRWEVMAAEEPEVGPWDWIFSCSVLQWTPDPGRVFAAWRRRLAPGGRLLCGLFVAGSLPELRDLAGGGSPLAWRTAGEWRLHLEQAGLRVIREQTRSRVFTHSSARVFLRSVHGVGAAPDRVFSAGRLRRLLADYERLHHVPGGVAATWNFYRFEAEI